MIFSSKPPFKTLRTTEEENPKSKKKSVAKKMALDAVKKIVKKEHRAEHYKRVNNSIK